MKKRCQVGGVLLAVASCAALTVSGMAQQNPQCAEALPAIKVENNNAALSFPVSFIEVLIVRLPQSVIRASRQPHSEASGHD